MNRRSKVRRNGKITRIRFEEVSTVGGESRRLHPVTQAARTPENLRSTAYAALGSLALIQWRARHLAGALSSLDFPGPVKRQRDVGSGDALIRTMRLTAAALAAVAKAARTFADPARDPGAVREAGVVLSRAMDALAAAAKDATATGPRAT